MTLVQEGRYLLRGTLATRSLYGNNTHEFRKLNRPKDGKDTFHNMMRTVLLLDFCKRHVKGHYSVKS